MRIYKKNFFVMVAGIILLIGLCTVLFGQQAFASWIEGENGIQYQLYDGQYAVGFVDIEEKRYYFDEEGYLVKGKFYVEEEACFYYSDEEGVIQTGRIETEQGFFIAEESGRLKTGFVEWEASRFYFDDKAQLVKGWFKDGASWYYADEQGALATGFLLLDGYRYYLNPDGSRVKDTILTIDGITYIFNKDGSIDENATSLYPVFEYLNQERIKNGLTALSLNTKVQACAILRASDLQNGFEVTQENTIEKLLTHRGVMCSGGYEFSYGGIAEFGIEQLIQSMKKDMKLLNALCEEDIVEVGLGVCTQDDISFYDIIFISK